MVNHDPYTLFTKVRYIDMRNRRYISEKDEFKRAEMACELAHEDAEYNTPSRKSVDFKAFMRLKNKDRNHIEELKFIAFKKRYGWW